MRVSNKKTKNLNYIYFGFLIPFIWMFVVMIFSQVLPFGERSLLYSDGYHQYYPFFKEFRHAILSGDSLLYSWNVGMGIDYLGLIAYYVASPLNLFSIFVPEQWLLYYFTFLTPIRLGLAGLFFSLFINRVFKKNDFSVPLFASFYALCAWALGYHWNVMWLDTFVLLPLVALGTYSLLKEKKFFLYTISLFLSIFSNYYVGFFTCIFVFFFFICYQICCWTNIKKFIFDLFRIVLFSLLAIGMTAILELPAFTALQTTQSSNNQFPNEFKLNIVDSATYHTIVKTNWESAKSAWEGKNYSQAFSFGWTSVKTASVALLNGMKQVAGHTSGGTSVNFKEADALPNLYCGVFTIFFGALFLTSKQIKLREKLCSVLFLAFLIISFLIRQLDYIWHGFHFTNMIPYRFSFIYSFTALVMAYRAYLYRKRFKYWQVLIAAILSCIPVLVSNTFAEFIEQTTSVGYWSAFLSAVNNFIVNGKSLSTLLDFLADFFYPVYNFVIIISLSVLMIICSVKAGYKHADTLPKKHAYIKKFRKRQRVASILILCVIAAELVFSFGNYSYYWNGAKISDYPKGTTNSKNVFNYLHNINDESLFYRAETTHAQVLNDAALNQYNGISTFTSSANVNITRFMQNLGFGAKDTYNRYCYESSSPVADLFLNLKYVIDRDGFFYEGPIIRTNTDTGEKYTSEKKAYSNPYYDVVYESSLVALAKNKAYLPLGFLCDPELLNFNFDNNTDQFAFEENLINAATGEYFDLWHAVNGTQLEIYGDENVDITSSDSFGKCRYTAHSDGIVTFAFTANRSGLFCMDLSQGKRNDYSVWLNNNHDALPDERIYSESYSLPQMLSVCAVEPGDVVELQFKCTSGESGRIEVYGSILDENAFRSAHSILSESTLNITEFSNTFIKGSINCHKDGLLYTSVPQNGENWKVLVDGKPAKIVLIGDVMIGIELLEGSHTIEFKYENNSFVIGAIISSVSFISFMTIWIVIYKPYKKLKAIYLKVKQTKITNIFRRKGKYDK